MMRYGRIFVCLLFPVLAFFMAGLSTTGTIANLLQSFGTFLTALLSALFSGLFMAAKAVLFIASWVLPFLAAGAAGFMVHHFHEDSSHQTSWRDGVCVGVASLSALMGILLSASWALFSVVLIVGVFIYFAETKELEQLHEKDVVRKRSLFCSIVIMVLGTLGVSSYLYFLSDGDAYEQLGKVNRASITRIYVDGSVEEQRAMDLALRQAIEAGAYIRKESRLWLMDEGLTAKNSSSKLGLLEIHHTYKGMNRTLFCSRDNEKDIQAESVAASALTNLIQQRLCVKRAAEF